MPGKELVPLTPAAAYQPGQPGAAAGVPWPQEKTSESESALVRIGRWAKRDRHYTVPLALLPGLWLAGLALHHFRALHYALPCGAVLAVCVWFFAPHKWDRAKEQWYARLSAILGVAWLIAAAWLGPLSGTVPEIVLASLLAAGCIAWGIPWFRHKRPRGMKQQQRLTAQCDAWWQSHCWNWNLGHSKVIDADLSRVTLRIRVRGVAGRHTLAHFRQAIPFIESAAEGQADIGMVRVEPVKKHPSEVDIFLKQENPLRGVVEYDPDIAPRSVHDPAPFGVKETADWKMTSLRKNRFTIGETRSGKSNDLLVAMANLSGCTDARPVLIDLKGGRSARPVLKASAAEYVITEIDEARIFLRMMVAEAKAREMYAYDGNEQLLATPDVPAWFTMVDETYGLTATEDGAGDPECRRHMGTIASQMSGVEGYLYVYTQNGSLETSVGTEQIRANLTHRTCYRVSEARHGAYCIPEYNRLDASKLEEQGTCYDKDGPEATPEQIRAPHMSHDLLIRVAGQNAEWLGPRPAVRLYCGDQVAFETDNGPVTWQQWWDTRWLRLHEAFRADSPQYQAAAEAASPQDAPPDDMLAALAQLVRDGIVTAADATADSLAEALAGRDRRPGRHAAAPTAAPESPAYTTGSPASMPLVPDDFRPDPELVKLLPQVIATQEERFCAALEAATADSPVTWKDLHAACGMSRAWIFDQLAALAEIGMVATASRGRHYAVPGADIRAGRAEIKARNDRLAREAADLVNAG